MFASRHLRTWLLMALMLAPLAAGADPRYQVTVVGNATSTAFDVNSSGQVVGTFAAGSGMPGFLWSSGTITDLGTLGGANSSAVRINDGGQIVGSADTVDSTHAFVYFGGTMRDLGTLGGPTSSARGISNGGMVVGAAAWSGSPDQLQRAFSWNGGGLNNLGTFPNGDQSFANGINDAGHIVGSSAISTNDPPEHPSHAFFYASGAFTDLGTLGGISSLASAINRFDQIVGTADTDNFYVWRAFLYSAGAMRDLGSLTVGGYSDAFDINALGQVVGSAEVVGGTHGFLYEGGSLLDLNSLIDPASGWTIDDARGINDAGQIAGHACRGLVCYAVRLDLTSPVPEAPGWLMLLAGCAVLSGGSFWRRAFRAHP